MYKLEDLKELPINVKFANKDLTKLYETSTYCHHCGYFGIVYEGPAEGYWCPKCGSSDQDE